MKCDLACDGTEAACHEGCSCVHCCRSYRPLPGPPHSQQHTPPTSESGSPAWPHAGLCEESALPFSKLDLTSYRAQMPGRGQACGQRGALSIRAERGLTREASGSGHGTKDQNGDSPVSSGDKSCWAQRQEPPVWTLLSHSLRGFLSVGLCAASGPGKVDQMKDLATGNHRSGGKKIQSLPKKKKIIYTSGSIIQFVYF